MSPPRPVHTGLVLALACAAQFVVILDMAIVNVALPSIQEDLAASNSSLQWVVIAYGLTLGGGLLLGGRIADLFGRRNALAAGLLVFTLASLVAGLADSLGVLVAARAVQGAGGAVAVPAALSIITATFPEGAARNRALGIFGAVGASAGTIGVVAGGALTSGPGWEWVFLINVPIGLAFAVLVAVVIPASARVPGRTLDVAGAVTVTAGLMAIVFGINRGEQDGWLSGSVMGALLAGVALVLSFVAIESRVSDPLVPLSIFRHRTLTAAIGTSLLLGAAFFGVIFQGTLYMQQALGYSALRAGLGWLAATVVSVVVAGVIAPRLVGAFGASRTLVVSQLIMAVGLLRLGWVSVDGGYWTELFPTYFAFGVGMGASLVALQIAAFSGIDPAVSGLAGGLFETSREIGGAVGVAAIATVAIARADDALSAGQVAPVALAEGYQQASIASATLSVAAAIVAGTLLRRAERGTAVPATEQLDESTPIAAPAMEPAESS